MDQWVLEGFNVYIVQKRRIVSEKEVPETSTIRTGCGLPSSTVIQLELSYYATFQWKPGVAMDSIEIIATYVIYRDTGKI
jgi:hypothetical protein